LKGSLRIGIGVNALLVLRLYVQKLMGIEQIFESVCPIEDLSMPPEAGGDRPERELI